MGFSLHSPNGPTQVYPGAFLGEILKPPRLFVDANNFDPAGGRLVDTFELFANTALSLTGIAGGVDGRRITVLNIGTNAITLSAESGLSLAANRFAFAAPYTLSANFQITLQWSLSTQRWHFVGNEGTGGGGGAPVGASYVVIALDGTLTNERRLQVGSGLSFADGGAGGDVTVSVAVLGITTGLIANANVTFAKIQDIATNRLLGRTTALSGSIEELTPSAQIVLAAGGMDLAALLTSIARVTLRRNSGADTGSRRRLNFIDTASVTWSLTDDIGNEEIDITATAAGGGSGITQGRAIATAQQVGYIN